MKALRYHPRSVIPKLTAAEAEAAAASVANVRLPISRTLNKFIEALLSESRDEGFLALMAFPENRRLDKNQEVILAAAARNDLGFFIRLGRKLDADPPAQKPTAPLHALLVDHWVEADLKKPSLCCFSDYALGDLAGLVLGDEFSYDEVTKTRQILGLKKAKIQIRTVRLKDEMVLAK